VSLKIPYRKAPDGKGGFGYYSALPVNADIRKAIGLDISKGAVETTLGVAGPTNTYLHDICLYVPGGVIAVRAGFSVDLPVAGLLGMQGFFDAFRITFDPTSLHCELDRVYKA
jgi:hypothetical protein